MYSDRDIIDRLSGNVPILLGIAFASYLFVAIVGWKQNLLAVIPGVAMVLIALGVRYGEAEKPVPNNANPLGSAIARITHSVLKHPITIWIGTISFGIYLWHVLVLFEVRGSWQI